MARSNQFVQRASRAAMPWRVPLCLLVGGLRSLAYHLAGETAFYRTYLPGQFQRCRCGGVSWPKTGLYLFLEWLWHLAYLTGQFTQTLRYIHRQAKTGQPLI